MSSRSSRWPDRKFLIWTCVLAAVPVGVYAVKSRSVAGTPPRTYTFPSQEVAALNAVLLKRFSYTDGPDFGIYRSGPLHSTFNPKSRDEQRVVRLIGLANMKVLLYTVGNGTRSVPHREQSKMPVKGPVFFTGKVVSPDTPGILEEEMLTMYWGKREVPVPKDAPDEKTLRGMAALVQAGGEFRNGINRRSGRWEIAVVPVLATKKECLSCHRARLAPNEARFPWQKRDFPVQLGDVLGMAAYCSTIDKVSASDLRAVRRVAK